MPPVVAANVQNRSKDGLARPLASKLSMTNDFKTRFTAGLLILLAVAAATLAWINFQKEREFQVPTDGVWWIERHDSLVADRIETNGRGEKAGIKEGDRVVAINGHELANSAALVRQMYRVGPWSKATYSLVRQGIPVDAVIILAPLEKSLNYWLRFIALIYLGIGIYVLMRRWTAPGSMHFYVFCLVSFIFYAFKYTGKFNQFDWIIYWANVVAGLLQPALFLHFVLIFPEKRQFVRKHAWAIALIYVPGLLLLARHVLALRLLKASESLRWNLDRLQMGYLALFFVTAAGVLWYSYRRASTPILRQQLKW